MPLSKRVFSLRDSDSSWSMNNTASESSNEKHWRNIVPETSLRKEVLSPKDEAEDWCSEKKKNRNANPQSLRDSSFLKELWCPIVSTCLQLRFLAHSPSPSTVIRISLYSTSIQQGENQSIPK